MSRCGDGVTGDEDDGQMPGDGEDSFDLDALLGGDADDVDVDSDLNVDVGDQPEVPLDTLHPSQHTLTSLPAAERDADTGVEGGIDAAAEGAVDGAVDVDAAAAAVDDDEDNAAAVGTTIAGAADSTSPDSPLATGQADDSVGSPGSASPPSALPKSFVCAAPGTGGLCSIAEEPELEFDFLTLADSPCVGQPQQGRPARRSSEFTMPPETIRINNLVCV
jgi:hypothetical protein